MISNWDSSLPEIIESLGLGGRFEVLTVSALMGVAKPDERLFLETAAQLGLEPAEILHVGDEVENDPGAAEAAGLQAVLLDRKGVNGGKFSPRIGSLRELASLDSGDRRPG